jgi:exosortase/archaeosortase family protein
VQTKTNIVTNPKLKAAVPLLKRTAAFLIIFVIFSGILGPRIISHGLVDKDGFEIYGGAGKSLLFGVLALSLLISRKSIDIKLRKWHYSSAIWLLLSTLTLAIAWLSVSKLISHNTEYNWAVIANVTILGSIIFAVGGTFGSYNLRLVLRTYKRELVISFVLAVLFYFFLYIVYGLWKVLAMTVLHSVQWLMNRIGITSRIVPPRTLVFSKFGINIAEYCSGIESIALFTALYGLVSVLDWDRFNHKRLLFMFPVALIVLFTFNILRVFVLILGGYYVNPQIAFSLFHTYAGMVFFVLYSILFWAASYRWMLKD